MATKTYQIPFDRHGNQMHYPNNQWFHNEHGAYVMEAPTFKDNYVFQDTLIIHGYSRGRSAACFEAKSNTTGKGFTIFLKDFIEIVKTHDISHGYVSGIWTFCKRGQNYGLKKI